MSELLAKKGNKEKNKYNAFPKKTTLEEKIRKKCIIQLAKKCAMYRNNIEAAKIDFEMYKESKEQEHRKIAAELEKSICEWEKRLSETKDKIADLIENEHEIREVGKKIRFEINLHRFIDVVKITVKAGAITLGLTYLIAQTFSVNAISQSPALFYPALVAMGLRFALYKLNYKTDEFFNNLKNKIKDDEQDIKNKIVF